MIKVIDGDLLESGADIIVHQVNCQGKMNSGVAKQIRERFPEAYEEYMRLYKEQKSKKDLLGTAQLVEVFNDTHYCYIANLFAQANYGFDRTQYTDVNALRKCFEAVKGSLEYLPLKLGKNIRIAMPYKIGCVRGGANWDEVYAIIEEVFYDCDVELWRMDKG